MLSSFVVAMGRDEIPSLFKSSTFNVQRSLRELFKV